MRKRIGNFIKTGIAFAFAAALMLSGGGMESVQAETKSGNDVSGTEVVTVVKEVVKEVVQEEDPGPSSTSEFLALADNYRTPTVKYGEAVRIVLPVVNYSEVALSDVVIQPAISNLVAEWPFEPEAAGATKTILSFPPYNNKKDVQEVRQEVYFDFIVRSDVKSGYYPLKFNVTYTRNNAVEKGTLTCYVKTVGTPESGSLDGNSDAENKVSKPRIIVTGFDTVPAQVFAGDTFMLTIHVQNTSKASSVTNVLFDMQAKEEGKEEDSKFAAFLPTSGSSSVYVDSIAPGASRDLVIEMSAKSDLAQKPYVLDVNMKYDAKEAVDLSDTASVSIPIYQEQRCETGDAEVTPSDITVGSQANIMFDVYNTGKTTLYNVWVKFKGDSISGGDSYLGTINSGATASVDAMVTGEAATMDDGRITAVISFEDESGNISEVEKELTLFVMEGEMGEYYDPVMDGEGGMDMGEMQSTGGMKRFLVPIIVVTVILIITVVIILKRRKKKKLEKAEQEADMEVLDEIRDTDR